MLGVGAEAADGEKVAEQSARQDANLRTSSCPSPRPHAGCEFAEKKKDMIMIISTHANSKRKRGAYRVRGGWGHHYRSSYVLLFVWLPLSLLRLQPESPRPTYMPRISTLDQVTPAQASSSSWTSATRRSTPACKASRGGMSSVSWRRGNRAA